MPEVQAAGGVVLRRRGDRTEVAIVHRPRYGDWTLPKGKLERGEALPTCAVRETAEESGLVVRLGPALAPARYRLPGGDRKVVHYWRADVLADHGVPAGQHEVDRVRWIDANGSLRALSFARDRRVVAQAAALPETTAVAVVRHGKARSRKGWHGTSDQMRPLVQRGVAQARDVVPLLAAFGIEDLRSSQARRCMQTMEPAARARGVPIKAYELLTEEIGEAAPEAVEALMARLALEAARGGRPLAVCGHRPVLPSMLLGLGLQPQAFGTGDVHVAHVGNDGRPVAWEHLPARR